MAEELVRLTLLLTDNAEAVCRQYLPAGQRQGRYWIVGDVRNARGRSMWVRLERDASGRPAGRWVDSATGEFGDLLDIIQASCGLASFGAALDEARRFLALSKPVAHRPIVPADQADQASRRAARLFAAAGPLPGSMAQGILRDRGLSGYGPLPALRYHPFCFFRPNDGEVSRLPAMIAAVTGLDGLLVGVQRTYLDPCGFSIEHLGKADVDTPRKAIGDLLGNAVRFGQAADVLLAGEGIETVLSAKVIGPDMPCAAALSASHLAATALPPSLKRLYIARDNDASGQWATSRLAARAIEAGIEPIPLIGLGKDLNDDLRQLGSSGLAAVIGPQFTSEDRNRYLAHMSTAT